MREREGFSIVQEPERLQSDVNIIDETIRLRSEENTTLLQMLRQCSVENRKLKSATQGTMIVAIQPDP